MIFISLVQLFLLFRSICGEAEPNPNFFIQSQQSQPEPEFWSQLNNVEPKRFVISGNNDQTKNEPNLMQTVLNAVNGINGDNNTNNSDIPEVVFQDNSYQEQSDQGGQQSMESVQKVYNLQPITRLIATSEVEPDKKNQIWRSPLPFMHPEDCPHHKSSKKSKSSKKKGRKQRKSESKPKTTAKPNIEMNESPFGSLLSSVLSHTFSAPIFEPEPMNNEPKAPSSFMMSITRKTEPQLVDIPPPPMIMALIRKRMEPQTEPEPELMPPFNPILALLSKLRPIEQKQNVEVNKEVNESADQEKAKDQLNFNFNINFTINNHNYPQPESRLFRPELPLPFFLKEKQF